MARAVVVKAGVVRAVVARALVAVRARGGGGGSEGGGSEGEGEGRSGSSGQEVESSSISSGGTTKSITTYNKGGGKAISISSGLFAVRMQGGGTRDEIWGSRTYGSGYPGSFARGVDNKGFPFYFWPISWGNGTAYGSNALDMYTGEYGQPDNSSYMLIELLPGEKYEEGKYNKIKNAPTQSLFGLISDTCPEEGWYRSICGLPARLADDVAN
ncbi:hypothetical protein B0H14DRAFT_2643556 [Mycena olivaceomarginata]|nr:hypothetical protein B0H14DRAFT_2643556 [Mycena olivaceomarginata]